LNANVDVVPLGGSGSTPSTCNVDRTTGLWGDTGDGFAKAQVSPQGFDALSQHTPQARIYRAFNIYGFENFANPEYQGVQADLFYCGSDGDSRPVVEQLISAVGLRPVYLGGVEQVRVVDSITGLWFSLAIGQKKGRHLAFKVLDR